MSFTTPRRCRISFVARARADWSTKRRDRRICRSGKGVWRNGPDASRLTVMNAHEHAHHGAHGHHDAHHGAHQLDWDAIAPVLEWGAETQAPPHDQAAAWLHER